jgi:hypothetical protein
MDATDINDGEINIESTGAAAWTTAVAELYF